MASIGKDPNGHRRILFVAQDGKRKTVRLGKVSQRDAESVKARVEQLVADAITKHGLLSDTAAWVANLSPTMADKLAAVGLIPGREPAATATLELFLTTHIAGRADLKPASKVACLQVVRDLAEYFGSDRDPRTITPGDGDDFKQWLIGRKLASATIRKRLQVSKSFFVAMRRRKLIDENPFDGVTMQAVGIRDRLRFVTRDEVDRVLAACPDHHWRTIVALARYGGLRTPSETLSVRWQDIDWDAGRIVVASPKTEHHAGKASRTIPMFPELRTFLADAFELAPDGAEYVVDPRFRQAAMGPTGWISVNLRTTFQKIVRRAGLQPWPRLFHNLRASRETELVETYPVQVVTSWLGNTPTVAMQHYLMTTDQHFEAAVRGDNAAQKAAQQPHAMTRDGSPATGPETQNPRQMPRIAIVGCTLQQVEIGPEGFEPPTKGL